jgi:putative membrane protein
MPKLKPEDFDSIRSRVEEAEKGTRAEIVPLVLPRSSDYRWVHSKCALRGLLIGIVAGIGLEHFGASMISAQDARWIAVLGGVIGFLLSMVPAFARAVIGQERLHSEVDRRAFAEFLLQGCAETEGRVGVLVMVSLFEHEIEIVADRGIQSGLKAQGAEKALENVCSDFSRYAREGKAIEGLEHVIRRLGEIFRELFPDTDGDPSDSLPNDLRVGRGK